MKLSDDLTLKDVLYVPESNVNLLSIRKLTQALGYSMTFNPDCCVMQDLTTKKMIGKGRQCNDLYYLFTTQNTHQSNVVRHSPNLWYQCLRHPSSSPLQVISQSNPEISLTSHDVCNVCPLAKQTRLTFPNSAITSKIGRAHV